MNHVRPKTMQKCHPCLRNETSPISQNGHSTPDQSTDLQIRELREYVENRGWELSEIYEDKATGTNDKRLNYQRLMNDARMRRFDVVLCWKMDRMFRSLKGMVTTLSDLSDVGVQFVSLRDQIDLTTASGRLMTHLLAAFSEFEAALAKERTIAGLRSAKARGIKLGRPKLQFDPEAVLNLRKRGATVREIGATLGTSKTFIQRFLAMSQNPPVFP